MKNLPKPVTRLAGAQPPGGAYEHEGPAALPDAHEINSESVWALFHESPAPPATVSDTETEFARRAALVELAEAEAEAEAKAKAEADAETQSSSGQQTHAADPAFADANFAPTGYSESVFDPTVPAPLMPITSVKP